ncbi:MAG: tail fiber protein [Bacteroidota bacterium]|nr:tail fiber protein [Bacteroidota bacterium]
MSSSFIGEIKMFGGNFAPNGWALCDGQLLPIAENEALFALIGTTYGGNGETTFALPDLRGRIPVHSGQGSGLSNRTLSEQFGSETTSLTVNQIPPHNHSILDSPSVGNSTGVSNSTIAAGTIGRVYTNDNTPANLGDMNAGTIANTGGSQPHDNLMPYLCINFIISLFGIFPSQN